MPVDDFQKRLFDLGDGRLKDAKHTCIFNYVFSTSDDVPTKAECAKLGIDSVIKIIFDKFSDGRGFTYARRIRDSGFPGKLVAGGHVIADQADYLRRCGFSHAEISPSKTDDWQGALSAIPSHFQHMAKSPRSRKVNSAIHHENGNS